MAAQSRNTSPDPQHPRANVTRLRVAHTSNDAGNTAAGVHELLTKIRARTNPGVSVVCAVQYADGRTEYVQMGSAARNTDRAHRLAAQLVDSLIWD